MIRGTESMDRAVERPTGISRRVRWLAGAAFALVVGAWLLAPTVRRWASAERSIDISRLRVATVTRGDLESDVPVEGRVVAAFHPKLFSPEPGIVELRVRPGEKVVEGDVLAVVVSPELRADSEREGSALASLRSELSRQRLSARQAELSDQQGLQLLRLRRDAARRELDRVERLLAEGLANRVEHDRARDAVAVAEVEADHAEETAGLLRESRELELHDGQLRVERQQIVVAELERRLAGLTVRAPFAGRVGSIDVDDRDAVRRDQPLLSVVDLSELEVEIGIPETYADDVLPGTPAVIRYGGTEYTGEVVSLSSSVEASAIEGRVVFTGAPPEGLKQSQRVSTRLVLERRVDVVKVPRGPFLESGGGRRIYVVADGLATLREIRVGATSVDEVEILEGLQTGEKVLLADLTQLDGARTVLIRN